MAKATRYRAGQRWGFKPAVEGFEDTFVIGNVIEAHPEFGWNKRKYEVYVQYTVAARESIPADWDGVILSLTDAGLNRSVTKLVKKDVKLPWWWVYGRRFKLKRDAPNGRGVVSCDKVSDGLAHTFEGAQQMAVNARKQEESLLKHREKYRSKKKPKPSTSVAESWQRIEAWYAENAHSLEKSLAPGATAAAIETFEKEIDAKLPEGFKESVRIHDGGGWWVPQNQGELLSLEGILGQWKMYSDWQAKGEYAIDSDDWRADDIKGPIKPVFWNKKRIYLTDNSGDHLTLDLDPPAKGKYGQILEHSHEVGPLTVIASGWAEFLQKLVTDLESGKYVYLEHQGSLELVADLQKE